MSSPYPVLDDRPIDQWKVAELKEELKRRKLTTKGLKDDLIKRLDEALQNEKEVTSGDVDNGFGCDPEDDTMDRGDDETEKMDDDIAEVDISDSLKVKEDDTKGAIDSPKVDEPPVQEISVVKTVTVSESVVSVIEMGGEEAKTSETQVESVVSLIEMGGEEAKTSETLVENGDPKPPLESEDSKSQLETEDSKPHLENEDSNSKPVLTEVKLDSSDPNNQVSEVSPVLGFQVKSDSISTDSVSIKDNVIADNVKLELEVVKAEVVELSSSNVVADGGELLRPMDEDPLEKRESIEDIDSKNAANVDMGKKNDSADVGSLEKLNLDRSSGDDSMEEDATESKIIESKYNYDEVGVNKNERTELHVVEKSPVDIVIDDLPAEKKDVVENKKSPAVPAEKRKLHDSEPIVTNEPSKRQRRWNSESLKVPEPQSSNLTPSTTPKETFQPTPLKRNFSRTDSNLSDDAPKERVVPPSSKPPTNSLRIDRFLRPFTLKAVNELLGKTGIVTCFWMDHIKTHCYVTYSSVEEATETRNAVYNLQWPPNGGRLLVAEFVDPQEVRTRAEVPAQPLVSPAGSGPTLPPPPPSLHPQPSPRQQQQALRLQQQQQQQQQQLPPPPSLPPPPPLSNSPPVRERLHLPPPPPLPEKLDPPIVTLDDLFRKTKATPRIYYLPLSEEQVAAKHEARAKNKQ